jgi:hypothetical protein
MIELAVATGWSLEAIAALDEAELATFLDVLHDRGARRRG